MKLMSFILTEWQTNPLLLSKKYNIFTSKIRFRGRRNSKKKKAMKEWKSRVFLRQWNEWDRWKNPFYGQVRPIFQFNRLVTFRVTTHFCARKNILWISEPYSQKPVQFPTSDEYIEADFLVQFINLLVRQIVISNISLSFLHGKILWLLWCLRR